MRGQRRTFHPYKTATVSRLNPTCTNYCKKKLHLVQFYVICPQKYFTAVFAYFIWLAVRQTFKSTVVPCYSNIIRSKQDVRTNWRERITSPIVIRQARMENIYGPTTFLRYEIIWSYLYIIRTIEKIENKYWYCMDMVYVPICVYKVPPNVLPQPHDCISHVFLLIWT